MKLAAKIWLLLVLTWGIGMTASSFLLYRLQVTAAGYDQLFEHDVHLQDSARQMQVVFRKQVQEWKDTLLRGYDPEALKKYSGAFQTQKTTVREMAEALLRETADPQIHNLAEEFAKAHKAMGAKYASALQVFVQGHGLTPRLQTPW